MLWCTAHYIGQVKQCMCKQNSSPALEVIKLEFILKLKIKCNIWLLADKCPQTAIIALYFEFDTVLKFYNLEARLLLEEQIILF